MAGPAYLDRCRRRYGDTFTVDLVPYAVAGPSAARDSGRWVFLANPADIREVFRADPATMLTGETNRFLIDLVGPESILVLDEPRHIARRKLLLPPFHGTRLDRYEELIEQATRREMATWPAGKPFALWPRMQAITLEVIIRAVFGVTGPGRLAHFHRLLTRLLNGMTSARFLAGQSVRRVIGGHEPRPPAVRRLLGPVDDAVFDEIARRRSTVDLIDRSDILSMLMTARFEDGSALTDRQLRDELITLLVAGHESTATMLAWAFERLLRHPDKLRRLRSEAVAGESTYTDAVVKETLRLRPVLAFVLRKLATPMRLGGYDLPAGTWVAPCAYLVQRDPAVYADPLAFQPERFLANAPGACTWTPFGGGARRCVGAGFAQLEMRVVLQTVLGTMDLRPATEAPEPVRRRFITLAPARGGRVIAAAAR